MNPMTLTAAGLPGAYAAEGGASLLPVPLPEENLPLTGDRVPSAPDVARPVPAGTGDVPAAA
ncbi:hypothetical protein [Streptomyces sp. NPDC016845]|uniref:hypothetical protein n=1 Tax=Streptomyces sp. NPDC016845 TaxID=3364972 RepID=UPI00378B1200